MTHPLENCSHSSNGWCLSCVKELWEAHAYASNRISSLLQAKEQSKITFNNYEKTISKIREAIGD